MLPVLGKNPLLVESQTRDFHNVQEVAWMSRELMDIRNERDPKKGKAPTNNKNQV
jgi:hypothetical protein